LQNISYMQMHEGTHGICLKWHTNEYLGCSIYCVRCGKDSWLKFLSVLLHFHCWRMMFSSCKICFHVSHKIDFYVLIFSFAYDCHKVYSSLILHTFSDCLIHTFTFPSCEEHSLMQYSYLTMCNLRERLWCQYPDRSWPYSSSWLTKTKKVSRLFSEYVIFIIIIIIVNFLFLGLLPKPVVLKLFCFTDW
jgi:hypothetical protein